MKGWGPAQNEVPKSYGECAMGNEKLSNMTVVILSGAIGPTWPGWGLKTVSVISALFYLYQS